MTWAAFTSDWISVRIAAEVQLKRGANTGGDQLVHQHRFEFRCLGERRRLNEPSDAIDAFLYRKAGVLSTIV